MSEALTIAISIVGTGFTIIAFIYSFIRNFRMDFDKRFEHLEESRERQETRWVQTNLNLDEKWTAINSRVDQANARLDALYNLLLKKMDEKV